MLEETTLAVLKSLPFGVFYCDRELVVRYINAPYARYLDRKPEEIIGRKIIDFIPSSRARHVMESGKEELYQEASLLSAKGNRRIMVNRIPVRNPQGMIIGFISQLISVGDEGWADLWHKMEYMEEALRGLPFSSSSGSRPEAAADSAIVSAPNSPLRLCIEKACAYAKTDEPVLISGPTGVGKELFAHAIRRNSPRAARAFICVNCASIVKEFINSELFGYAPGAFTGAQRRGKPGLVEMADGGTLFLDEIGDLPLDAQGSLLRALETHQIRRINALDTKDVNFRLISATNKNLWEMCRERTFREDLYFRLSALSLEIPPLAERTDDIPPLVRHFFNKMQRTDLDADAAVMALFRQYAWPGNVRELRNVLVYAAVTAGDGQISVRHLPPNMAVSVPQPKPAEAGPDPRPLFSNPQIVPARLLEDAEKDAILSAVRQSGGNFSRAARLLGISRTTLYTKLKRYDAANGRA